MREQKTDLNLAHRLESTPQGKKARRRHERYFGIWKKMNDSTRLVIQDLPRDRQPRGVNATDEHMFA